MDRTQLIIIAGAVVAAGYLLTQFYVGQLATSGPDDDGAGLEIPTDPDTPFTFLDDLMATAVNTLGLWKPPAKYAGMIAASEARNGIPAGLLARLLYQECRWRDDIITGRVRSPAGAVGIAQFMPATAAEWNVNPLDVQSSIDGAGRYLAWLRKQFTTWTQALAAYNWGIGNVQRKGLAAAPLETRKYYAQILADVNTATGTTWA